MFASSIRLLGLWAYKRFRLWGLKPTNDHLLGTLIKLGFKVGHVLCGVCVARLQRTCNSNSYISQLCFVMLPSLELALRTNIQPVTCYPQETQKKQRFSNSSSSPTHGFESLPCLSSCIFCLAIWDKANLAGWFGMKGVKPKVGQQSLLLSQICD